MPGNCKFNDNWLVKAAYKSWLKRSSNVDKAFCTVCGKDFSISAMDESAVSTHAKGKNMLIVWTWFVSIVLPITLRK